METPTYPKRNPYEYADRIVRVFTRKLLRMTERVNLLPIDELNILGGTRDLVQEILEETKRLFLRLARYVYARDRGLSPQSRAVMKKITPEWVEDVLLSYDPVTKTVFVHELYRKCERLGEAILASGSAETELRPFIKAIVRLVRQESITITDEAHKEALRDENVKKVVWLTRQDERRCGFCGMLHGQIFDADKVPHKPHANCRCWTKDL